MSPVSLPARAQVLPELTWNIADIFPSDEAWEAELERLAARLEALQRFVGHLGDSPTRLLEWFNESGPLRLAVSKAATYAHMQHDVDTADQAAAARDARAQAADGGIEAAATCFVGCGDFGGGLVGTAVQVDSNFEVIVFRHYRGNDLAYLLRRRRADSIGEHSTVNSPRKPFTSARSRAQVSGKLSPGR